MWVLNGGVFLRSSIDSSGSKIVKNCLVAGNNSNKLMMEWEQNNSVSIFDRKHVPK